MKTLLIIALLASSGCASRNYVDTEVSIVKHDARRRTLSSHSSLLDEIERVETRLETLRKSVLSSSEIRRQQHRAYWTHKLDVQQAELDDLRREIIPGEKDRGLRPEA